MTKNEERKVLAQIKKLIESTGEDSYISTAFQGCIDHAETNIENDWACSWYQTAAKLTEDNAKMYLDYTAVKDELRIAKQNIETLEYNLAETQKQVMNKGIYQRVWMALERDEAEAKEKMHKLANLFADMADQNPTEDAMRQVMQSMANVKKELLEASALLKAFEKYE